MHTEPFNVIRTWVGKKALCVLFNILFLGAFASGAYGHKVYVFAWVEGDTVYTDSYFPDKRKIAGGKIEVFDPSGKKLLEGTTDEQGAFSFKVPVKTDLRIVLDATMGHRAEFILGREEITGDDSGESGAEEGGDREISSAPHTPGDLDRIRDMLEKTLDVRLKPIERKLARMQEEKGPGLTEIIGGIGYILGLMGIALYFKNRNKG